jgi:hypothetical protein
MIELALHFFDRKPLAENRHDFFPKRPVIFFSIMLRCCRLRGADGIGRREATDETGVQAGTVLAIGQQGLLRIDGMFVMSFGIECVSHGNLH